MNKEVGQLGKKKRIDYLVEAMNGHGFTKQQLDAAISVLISMEINMKKTHYKHFIKDIWMALQYHVRK